MSTRNGERSSAKRDSKLNDLRRARLRNGIELHYTERGTGAALVLVHGGAGDLESWSAQISSFSRRYRVITYSRRYSYPNRNAPVAPAYSAYDDAEDLAGLLQFLGLERARLVGTSYGAFAALALALKRPHAVTQLVLAEPPVHRLASPPLYHRFISEIWRPAGHAFRKGHAARAMEILIDGMCGRPLFARLPFTAARSIMRNAQSMKALVFSRNPFPSLAPADLANLTMPVLLVAGEHTTAIHRRVNRALAGLISQAVSSTIPGASHTSPREKPGAFNALVLRFLISAEGMNNDG